MIFTIPPIIRISVMRLVTKFSDRRTIPVKISSETWKISFSRSSTFSSLSACNDIKHCSLQNEIFVSRRLDSLQWLLTQQASKNVLQKVQLLVILLFYVSWQCHLFISFSISIFLFYFRNCQVSNLKINQEKTQKIPWYFLASDLPFCWFS